MMTYHVQETAHDRRDGFPYFAHHDSISALWTQKWRALCSTGIYPFTDGVVDDFAPVFTELIRTGRDAPSLLYRPDDYAGPFLAAALRLVNDAERAEAAGHCGDARTLFLRAATVYRIGRFPINRSPLSEEAWTKGKAAYERAGLALDPPSITVDIPFTAAAPSAGDRDASIGAYLRLPKGERPAGGWPVLLFICGLDAYRTDHTWRTDEHVKRGFACLSFEIPGTGDCPAAPNDPASPDRLMTSVLDWLSENAGHRGFDLDRVVARGISTGGYYAFRVAHTHADRLFAVVAQGGGCHHMFDPAWIDAQDRMEYPFALAEALAWKFGYRDPDPAVAVTKYKTEAHKFSLLTSGILDRPSCRMLVINGMEDSIFPIEDSVMVAARGTGRDLVARADRGHMGNPGAEEISYDWIDAMIAGTTQGRADTGSGTSGLQRSNFPSGAVAGVGSPRGRDRIVVVTGAAGGIGRLVVERFVANGDDVVATDVDAQALQALKDSQAPGTRLQTIVADVSSEADCAIVAALTREQHGRCDVLVNVAGFFPIQPYDTMTAAEFRRVVDINLTGVFLMVKAMTPMMREHTAAQTPRITGATTEAAVNTRVRTIAHRNRSSVSILV